ncbi:hypothetical protein LTR08_002010 [Meristemomyces frigidus]|nr:hypothetical protein LTR08_002010 [Meristemomyces frigidus]
MSTITEVITKDHRNIEQYYNEVVQSSDLDHQERYGNQFTWEVSRHSHAEELVVYPAFEKYLGHEGKAMAEKDRAEHHEVKLFLKTFQNMKAKDADYVSKIKEVMARLSSHIEEEERDDLPALEKALSGHAGVSESLAKKFGTTKALVPSRSHPKAGEHPPFETVVGALAGPIDHVADVFRKFPDNKISPNPSTK